MKNIVALKFLLRANSLLILFVLVLLAGTVEAATVTTTGSGNWSSTTPNAPWPGGVIPAPGDDIVVGNGFILTVDGARTCNSLSGGNGSVINVNAALTITTNLSISDGTIFNANQSVTVNGTTTIGAGVSGIISLGTPGTKVFVGLVTINAGASWSNAAEAVTFRGGITNNGNFSAGTAIQTFATSSQILTGNFTIPNLTVTGAAVALTNTNTLTVGSALSGTGRITQGAGATLNIGGTSGISNMTATATGNTVNYTGAAQTVHSNAYENLILSGSGVITLQAGTTSITGDLTLSGTVSTTGVIGLTVGDDVTIGSGTSFTTGAFTHNVSGDFTNNGTFTGSGSTLVFNGATQNVTGGSTTFNNVTLSGTGTKTFGVSPTLAIIGTLSINNGVIAGLSNANTHTANSLLLGGAIQPAGTWGSTSSSPAATNQNNTFFSGTGLVTVATGANSYYSIASTAWNVNTTWSNIGFGGAPATGTPGPGDFVYIGDNQTVNITGAETCDALFFDAGTSATSSLTISSGSLTVSGAVTIAQATSGSNILNVGTGALTANSIAFTTGGGAGQQLSISSGTATVSGNITGIGASSTIQFTGAGLLQVGGSIFSSANGTLTSVAGSTVEYTGAAQTVQALGYNNLRLSGSGTKTLAANTTVGGNLIIGDGVTFTIGAFTFAVTGTTTVGGGTSGTLSLTSNTGTKTFTGLVTISSGATWSNTTEAVVFQGGITNIGTFTAGTGLHTFNTNSQTLTGNFIIPSVTVTGGTIVLTNTNTLTVGTALAGTGRITQGASATLNIGGTSTITNMTATASGNTVNYTGAAQTVHSNAYENLGLSGSGIKTLQVGTIAITGDLTLSGTVSTTSVIGATIGGDVTIGSGTSFTTGAFTHNVSGDFTNNGTFTGTGSTLVFNGTTQSITGGSTSFNNVTLSGTGTKTFGVSPTLAITGTLSINSGVIAGLSNANTHTANSLLLGGAIQPAGTWGSTSSSPAATNQNNAFFSGTGLVTVATGANTYYSIASTAWNVNTTWSNTGFGGAPATGTPGPGDFVNIGDNQTVNITGAETCSALFFDAGTTATSSLTISSGSLTVSGAVTIAQATSGSNILNVGTGTLTASSIAFTTGGGAGQQLSISSGTATVSGNITGIGASSTIQFTGAGLLQVGGSIFSSANGTLTSVAGSTVEYTGAAQTVQALGYNNLRLSGSGTKTLAANTTVGGNLIIGDGVTFTIGAFTFAVTGTTTVGGGTSGTLSFTSNTGTKTFTGLVTIASGATWTNTTEIVTFQGGITNNGTFTAGTGAQTFNTNSQTLTGTFTIPNVTVTGAAVVLTNTNSLSVGTALAGSGRITQGAAATLNIGGTSTITNMTATASGNTVNYTGAAQTVHSNAYENLGLSGSGIKTLQVGTIAITGDLTLSGAVSATGVIGVTIGGDVTIGSGTSLTTGAFTYNVGGDFTNNGTFTGTGSTLVFNGTTQSITGGSTSFNNVTLSGIGTKTFGVSPTLAIAGTLSINNGSIADLSNANTHTANALILGGGIQPAGTWGSTSSSPAATNQNNTFFSGTGLVTVGTGANTYYSIAGTAWNVNTTWSNTGFGGAAATGTPGPGDFVYIGGGLSVTVSGTETCSALFFDAGTGVTNTLTISSGSLTVSGAVTIPQTVTTGANILDVGAGTLTAGSVAFTSTPGGAAHRMTISTGTAIVSGNITGSGTSSTIQFTGVGLLQVGGSIFSSANGTLTSVAGSTVEYTGVAQTVQALGYNNLRLSGSGTKTLAANTTVGGTLTIGNGVTFAIGAFTFTVTGTTTVGGGTSGTLSINSATGTKTFIGLVTIATGATWTNTTEAVTFRNGITNNGTFTAGTGAHTFSTNSQTLTGNFTIPSVAVAGAAVVLTNTNSLTVGTALSGSGRITQGTSATLNIGGTSGITNMTATATGNTVNYTGAAQTVHSNAYENLGLSGSGVKTLQAGTTTITGDLTLSGTASTTGVVGLTISRDITIGTGTTFTSGAFDHAVGRHWINNGTFNHSSRRITFSGGATTQNIQGTAATTFFDLRIGNGSANPDVQLDQTAGVNLVGEMTFVSNAILDADGPGGNMVLTVVSTAGGDGRIGPLSGTADVTGDVTVQRYMDAEGKIYRYISTPVDHPTAEDLQGEIPITGPFTGSSFPPQTGCTSCAPCTGCVLNNTSMYQYDETIIAGLNSRYVAFPSSGGTNGETMLPGRGYAVYVRNDVSATTWNLRSELNKHEVNLNATISGSNDGYNLVGNPYASPIDWESGAWTRNGGINSTFYIWDNSINNYASYTLGGGSTNGGSRYIATGQAFWVIASGTPDLRAQEGIKADQASVLQATFFRVAKPIDNLRIKLIADHASDEVLVKLNEDGASENYDFAMDALEFPSDTLLSLHSLTAENKRLAVNVFGHQSEKTTEISLGLTGVKHGDYTIDFLEFENFSTQTNVYLLDRFNETMTEILPSNKQYSFTVTSDTRSSGDGRFVVYLTHNGGKPEVSTDFETSITVYPNPTEDVITVRVKSPESVSAELINSMGVRVMNRIELEKSGSDRTGQFDLRSLSPGVYIIQLQRGISKSNQRILKK